MKPTTFLLCFAATTLSASLQAQQQQPKFQSLTPGAAQGSASWVNHLNAMKEAERQRRVQTYGMPAAPPNRWAQRQAAPPRPAPRPLKPQQQPRAQPSSQINRGFPKSNYQSSPSRRIQAAVKTPPKREVHALHVAAVRPNQRKAPATVRPKPLVKAHSVAWNPSNKPAKDTAASRRQASIRRELAFMPNTRAGRTANPWAPYGSRLEYQQALNRSKWQPRGPALRAPQKQRSAPASKRRWSLKSLFTRKKQRPAAKSTRKRSETSPKAPSSTSVTSGLPQRNQSGPVIETTLFRR